MLHVLVLFSGVLAMHTHTVEASLESVCPNELGGNVRQIAQSSDSVDRHDHTLYQLLHEQALHICALCFLAASISFGS